MPHPFDPGYGKEPFRSLCAEYPEADVYPPGQFRVEWGPIFHRGRLDGSARVLVIGQDPAQHESVVRRILVGEAGRRVQGFLAKLGIAESAVFVNTYLYSVYGGVKAATKRDPRLVGYRNRWLDALLVGQPVEAVVALGQAADEAWTAWKATPNPPALYGDTWADGDRVPIPERDFPAGLPRWMQENDGWAKRAGKDDLAKRRTISITVPKGVVS
jgi:hypothetical protein